jgi:hypothetical protein
MAIAYHIYANDGLGGLVNYATPIGTTSGLSFTPPVLAAPSDNTFVVRAFDTSTDLEEANTEASVRIVIDGNGQDVTSQPNAPFALTVRATAGGGCLATWAYNPGGQGSAPTGFYVYLSAGNQANYANPAATVAYVPGRAGYSCALSGLADATLYTVAVRAYNATAIEPNTTVIATVIGDSTPPENVDSLTAVPTFQF